MSLGQVSIYNIYHNNRCMYRYLVTFSFESFFTVDRQVMYTLIIIVPDRTPIIETRQYLAVNI